MSEFHRDSLHLALYTAFCMGLGALLSLFYIGTAWGWAMAVPTLGFPFALLLWMVFVGVFVHHHVLHFCLCHPLIAGGNKGCYMRACRLPPHVGGWHKVRGGSVVE